MDPTKPRILNFELLRVLAMIFVVLVHFIVNGGNTPQNVTFENGFILNSISYPFFSALSYTGVICFVLISSYFICESNILRVDKLIKTWSVTVFYSILMMLICHYRFGLNKFDIIGSFLPLWSDQYWFVTKYIALLILAPFISVLIKNLTRQGLLKAIFAMSFLTVTITCGIPYGSKFFSDSPLSVAPFVLMFLLASYIKLYDVPLFIKQNSGTLFFSLIAFQGITGILINLIHGTNNNITGGFSISYNALSLLPATLLFIWFKEHKFSNSSLFVGISKLAPYSFAVYLIHDNQHIRYFLWNDLVRWEKYWNSPMWIIYAIMVPIFIYLVCTAIDTVRTMAFRFLGINKVINKSRKYNILIR